MIEREHLQYARELRNAGFALSRLALEIEEGEAQLDERLKQRAALALSRLNLPTEHRE